jgi:hypothetical protein
MIDDFESFRLKNERSEWQRIAQQRGIVDVITEIKSKSIPIDHQQVVNGEDQKQLKVLSDWFHSLPSAVTKKLFNSI